MSSLRNRIDFILILFTALASVMSFYTELPVVLVSFLPSMGALVLGVILLVSCMHIWGGELIAGSLRGLSRAALVISILFITLWFMSKLDARVVRVSLFTSMYLIVFLSAVLSTKIKNSFLGLLPLLLGLSFTVAVAAMFQMTSNVAMIKLGNDASGVVCLISGVIALFLTSEIWCAISRGKVSNKI